MRYVAASRRGQDLPRPKETRPLEEWPRRCPARIVVGLAVTRDGFPVRHWVFPGHTVEVSTVAKVKADLKGWRLHRCVFVGDAGRVSEKNLKALSGSGGKYIVCMPIHRGGEVEQEVLSRPGRYTANGYKLSF